MTWECCEFGDPRLPHSFWNERYVDANGCWLRKDGTKTISAVYRLGYEILVGPIPAAFVLDHLCVRTEQCSNPDHLEAVTRRTNSQRNTNYFPERTERIPENEKLVRRVMIRLAVDKRALIRAAARKQGMTVSGFMRTSALRHATERAA